MYRIMILFKDVPNSEKDLYQFYTEKDVEGVDHIYQTSDIEELKTKIEALLATYSKSALHLIKTVDVDYDIKIGE